ncbi:MAG: maltose O-acetyltransferase [Rhodothermales bacterium]|jgi:maltose O-acetyltransferase
MRLLKELWFQFVMLGTRVLPEVTPILRLRGWLVKPVFHSCGSNLQITRDVRITHPHKLSIGSDVYLSGGCWILASGGVEIGDEVMLGPYSIVVAGDHTKLNGSYRFGPAKRAPIKIGSGSWVGAHGVVTMGTTLGPGCLLAAGSVATRSIPAHSIAGGVPAKVLKKG